MQSNLSASNAKAIALLAKLLEPTQEQLDSLIDLEKDSWNKIKSLANNGYADSNMLNASLESVIVNIVNIEDGNNKAQLILSATTHEVVVEILNTL